MYLLPAHTGTRALAVRVMMGGPIRNEETPVTKDELIAKLHQRQNNGMTDYVTLGELVAMVPSDQVDAWQAVIAKAKATDAQRDLED